MPENARAAAIKTEAKTENKTGENRVPEIGPHPTGLQAQLLYLQRTIGNQSVANYLKSGQFNSAGPEVPTNANPSNNKRLVQLKENTRSGLLAQVHDRDIQPELVAWKQKGTGFGGTAKSRCDIASSPPKKHSLPDIQQRGASVGQGTIRRNPNQKAQPQPLLPHVETIWEGDTVRILIHGQTVAIARWVGGENLKGTVGTSEVRVDTNLSYSLEIRCPYGWKISFPASGIQALNRMFPHWKGNLHGIEESGEVADYRHIYAAFGYGQYKADKETPKDTGEPAKGPNPAATPATGRESAPSNSPRYNENLVPPDWVKQPSSDDILTAVVGNRMVALPALGSFVILEVPQSGITPDIPVFTVPTVAKEGLVAVNVGGRTGFMLDAGGNPIVVFPFALAAIQDALKISSIKGVAVTHIHADHVRSLVDFVITNRITPENLHFPAAFAVNPSAPSSLFANGLRNLESDPRAQTLGYRPGASYSVIRTPQGGTFFHNTLKEGEVTFDFYGLSQEFRDLEAQRTKGQKQPNADAASPLTRVTHEPTGYRVLYVSDLRSGNLSQLRQAMGNTAYQEMLSGVKVIEGLQHHLGALEDKPDRDGLVELLKDTYLKSGELTVVAQSQEQYGGRQFLNRSLIEALNQMGIDVHVAMEPGPGGQVGTISGTAKGQIETRGGGKIESHFGSQELQMHVSRLIRLRKAEEILSEYEQYLTIKKGEKGEKVHLSGDVRVARQNLENALNEYLETTVNNVRTGTDRGQASLQDPVVQRAARQKVETTYSVEDILTPHNMQVIEEVGRVAPYRRIWEEEVKKARETGELSERGIEALWEINPSLARRMVGESELPRRMKKEVISQLPGQPVPVGTRVGAGVMLAITVVEELAPVINAVQQNFFDEDVGKGLGDIMWWQSKGVFPAIEAFKFRYLSKNVQTTDPKEIQQLLDDRDIDYLVLKDISDEGFAIFSEWAKTHLINIQDWAHFITNSKAVKKEGDKWKYHCGKIIPGTVGRKIEENWADSDFLTKILNPAFDRVMKNTQTSISAVEKSDIPAEGPAFRDPAKHYSPVLFAGKPQAVGRKKFKDNITDPKLYTLFRQWSRTGFSRNSLFYVFPNSASPNEVPSGYAVVGGADSLTYYEIYETQNLVVEGHGYEKYSLPVFPNKYEVFLARMEDLEDVK